MRIAFVGVMVPLLWGATCDPPDPPCSVGECPDGTASECVGECVATVGVGEECSVDPCLGPLCEYGLTCTPVFGSVSVCQPAQNQSVFFCTNRVPCSTGNYCRRFTDSGGDLPRPQTAPRMGSGYVGQCVSPVAEGESCVGDWATHGNGPLCNAGTECRDDPRTPGARACFRPCADANDCACPGADPDALTECVAVVSPPPEGGICGQCNDNGEACGPGEWGCCDLAATCDEGSHTCCRADTVACTSFSECCPGSVCGTGGDCVSCPGPGDDPNAKVGGDGCCHGLVARFVAEIGRTVCALPCTEGRDCAPRECPANTGRTSCDAVRPTCVPDRGPEVACDTEDNDCDRAVDEFDPPGCTGPVPPSTDINPETELPYFLGCPGLVLPGAWACRDLGAGLEPVCEVTGGFCAVDSLGNPINAAAVGQPDCFTTGALCFGNEDCSPAEACCNVSGAGPRCGLLRDADPFNLCWEPGERSTTPGACPYVDDSECVGLTCAACLESSRCGWCGRGGGNTCVDGSSSGPFGGECDLSHWFTDPDDAPLVCL